MAVVGGQTAIIRPVRPRDAASLIMIDRSEAEPRFLLGKRHQSHKFMPGKYVFPGGKTDACDFRIMPGRDIDADCLRRLHAGLGRRGSETRARALALSAVREAFEEAGILVGLNASFASIHPEWQPFADRGLAPDLQPLRYVARAVTPPQFPRRYDTRFFAMFRDLAVETEISQHEDNEMLDFSYVTHAQSADMNLPGITRLILQAVVDRLAVDPDLNPGHPVPTYLTRRGKHVCEFA
jgi:8-oxo-dGTP pyrophosphatase MutT (NUDIX family)